jgi:hypothetical protein
MRRRALTRAAKTSGPGQLGRAGCSEAHAQVFGRGTRSRGRSTSTTRPGRARPKDRAGGGPAEEQAWTRGRGMRLLGIEEARTRSVYVTTVLNKSVSWDLNSLQTWLYLCCNICAIRSFDEPSGRTTARLGSTGLRAMPSEGRRSRHSGASTADNAPGLGTISDDYGQAANCRSKDLAAAAGAHATRMSRVRAGDAAGGRELERRRAMGPTTTRQQGAGRCVSPGARDSESSASQLGTADAGYLLL